MHEHVCMCVCMDVCLHTQIPLHANSAACATYAMRMHSHVLMRVSRGMHTCLTEIRRDVSVPGPALAALAGRPGPASLLEADLTQEALMCVTHTPKEFKAARCWEVSGSPGFRVSSSF